jgi:hypothetical protein
MTAALSAMNLHAITGLAQRGISEKGIRLWRINTSSAGFTKTIMGLTAGMGVVHQVRPHITAHTSLFTVPSKTWRRKV